MNSSSGAAHDTGRIPSLDGLRGLAILMVLLGHGSYSLPAAWRPLVDFFGNGALGVKIFFVLSGFLIYSLSTRELSTYGRFDWKQFYVRRALRIFPLFYLYVITVVLLTMSGWLDLTWQVCAAAATFSLNYRHLWDGSAGAADYHVLGHYWTLALEEQFYLLWPLIVVLLVKRKLLLVVAISILAAPLLRVAVYAAAPESRGQIGMMFHTSYDSIAFGILLAELMRHERWRAVLKSLVMRDFLLVLCMLYPLFISPCLTRLFHGAYTLPIGTSVDLICISFVIASVVMRSDTWLYRILNVRLIAYIGILSYSLYVWNNLFLNSEGAWIINQFPMNYALLFLLAFVSYRYIEKPVLGLKYRLYRSKGVAMTSKPLTNE